MLIHFVASFVVLAGRSYGQPMDPEQSPTKVDWHPILFEGRALYGCGVVARNTKRGLTDIADMEAPDLAEAFLMLNLWECPAFGTGASDLRSPACFSMSKTLHLDGNLLQPSPITT